VKYAKGRPDGHMELIVAEHFHVLPDQVEQMDVLWFNRAIEYLEGLQIFRAKEERKSKRR
jgi:hypothetical protein